MSTIANKTLPQDNIHFHDVGIDSNFLLVHELDATKFDYLYSGTCFFNFYANLVWKLLHHSLNIFRSQPYDTIFLKLIDTARYVSKFDNLQPHIFFNFDELVDQPRQFHNCIVDLQNKYQINDIDFETFLIYRESFFKTCVNVKPIYENFDNHIWLAFVLAELMKHEIFPVDFVVAEKNNISKVKDFAMANYHIVKENKVFYFENGIVMPDLMNLKNRYNFVGTHE